MFRYLLALMRLFGMIFLTLWYLLPVLLVQWLGRGEKMAYALSNRKKWARKVNQMLGVNIEVASLPPPTDQPVIYISNHRSYFDPIATLCFIKAFPIAKAEVSAWPLVGFAARSTGILFVKRESRKSRAQTLGELSGKIREGFSILIYPEGTTSDQPGTKAFRKGAFRVAAAEGIPIIPVAVEYRDPKDYWINDDTFVDHFFRRFGLWRKEIRMAFGPILTGTVDTELMERTRSWINVQLLSQADHQKDN